jgi:hypothetical protein
MRVSKSTSWVVGVVAFLALGVTSVLTLGISLLFWAPVLIAICIGMWGVWAARVRRQRMELRDTSEVKDPLHADRPWPTQGVTDDRLPQP